MTEKKKEEKAAEPAVDKSSVTKSETGRPSVEPVDPAPGKPKIDEDAPPDQKLADGGGAQVYAGSPLVKGIPVVVPINDSAPLHPDTKLVWGVTLAAPVVSGTPEMIANAQAEHAVEDQSSWNKGDIKSVHFNGPNEVQIDLVDADGAVVSERHRIDARLQKEFQDLFQGENWKADTKKFYRKHFDEDTLIEEPV